MTETTILEHALCRSIDTDDAGLDSPSFGNVNSADRSCVVVHQADAPRNCQMMPPITEKNATRLGAFTNMPSSGEKDLMIRNPNANRPQK